MASLRRILLADDSPNDIELTLSALEENALANAVDVVADGVEALDYLRCRGAFANRETGLPGVVLLDIKMPRIDGLEVLREIRSDATLRHLPVVMLTSSREQCDIIESYELGVNGYVVKPVEISAFIRAIQHLGLFWALLNEPPPERDGRRGRDGQEAA